MNRRQAIRGLIGGLLGCYGAGMAAPLVAKTVVTVAPALPPLPPGAISIPFACLPLNLYIQGPAYMVIFDRKLTVEEQTSVLRNGWSEKGL